jgi:hypothetical protein
LRHALIPASGGKTKKNDDVGKCRPHSKYCYVDIRNLWRKTLSRIGPCGGVDHLQNEKIKSNHMGGTGGRNTGLPSKNE